MNITLWYKQNSRTKDYEFNHLEEHYNFNNKPTPLKPEFTAQNDRKNYNWKKSFAQFKDGALEALAESHGLKMKDLKKMSHITKRAFKNGHRY